MQTEGCFGTFCSFEPCLKYEVLKKYKKVVVAEQILVSLPDISV